MSKVAQYKKSIAKEDINLLELDKYNGEITLVDTDAELEKACSEIEQCSIIGIDTETKPSFKKGMMNTVALLQIATDKKAYIVDEYRSLTTNSNR